MTTITQHIIRLTHKLTSGIAFGKQLATTMRCKRAVRCKRALMPMRNILLVLSMALTSITVAQPSYAQEEIQISQAELDQILAPIALYPDTLLSHILIGATYPLEIIQADRWAQANKSLSSDEILQRAEQQDWDPSIQALTAFPDVLQKMSENLDWTQTLGDTFLLDEAYVLASVQNLRQKARDNGSLNDLERLRVVDDSGDIVLEPVEREVVYVPRYDVRVVYGPWWWNNYPPVHWAFHHHGLSFIWGPRVYVGPRISFSAFSWGSRHVVRVNRSVSYRNNFLRRGRILGHNSARRWVHNPVHRRGAYYRHASVNKRYTPNRSHRVSPRFSYGNKARTPNKVLKARRIESKKRAVNINQRLKDKRISERRQQIKRTQAQQSRNRTVAQSNRAETVRNNIRNNIKNKNRNNSQNHTDHASDRTGNDRTNRRVQNLNELRNNQRNSVNRNNIRNNDRNNIRNNDRNNARNNDNRNRERNNNRNSTSRNNDRSNDNRSSNRNNTRENTRSSSQSNVRGNQGSSRLRSQENGRTSKLSNNSSSKRSTTKNTYKQKFSEKRNVSHRTTNQKRY